MRDGINLSRFRCLSASAKDKFPALLAFSIYTRICREIRTSRSVTAAAGLVISLGRPLEAGDTKFFVSRGYVHVIGSPRGVANRTAADRGNGTVTISSNGSRSSPGAMARWAWLGFPDLARSSFLRLARTRRI